MSTHSFISTRSKCDIILQVASDNNITIRVVRMRAKGPYHFEIDVDSDQLKRFNASLKMIKVRHKGFIEINEKHRDIRNQLVVKHPNFDLYLKTFATPVSKYYSEDDMTEMCQTHTHEWVKDIVSADKFNTADKARAAYTSPLCSTVLI